MPKQVRGAPTALLHDDLQQWYPLPVRRQEDGKNPEELATRRVFHSMLGSCVMVALLVLAQSCQPDSRAARIPELRFTAKPVKPSFHEDEKVMFRFTIQNQSKADVIVSPALILNHDIHLEIKKDAGIAISWCGVIVRRVFLGDEYVTLHPGKSLSMNRQISCDDSHDSGFSFPGPGEYSVTATYQFPVSPKKLRDNPGPVPFALGPYKAESARFTIVAKAP